MVNPLWDDIAARGSVTLSEQQHAQLARYLDLLLEANATMNLTRITDRAAAEIQHVGDALTVLPFLPPTPHTLADVGTGGGVPGIPLAIARPDISVTLIEATQKKAHFLRQTVATLQLPNVQVVCDRAETAGHSALRESFDVATARAVGALAWLVEWCIPLVKKGGKVLALKGAKISEELPAADRAMKQLNTGPATVHPVELPQTEHHVIVEIPKPGKTDSRYPRLATQAKGRPL